MHHVEIFHVTAREGSAKTTRASGARSTSPRCQVPSTVSVSFPQQRKALVSTMTPEDVAGFASRVGVFTDGQIDRINTFIKEVYEDTMANDYETLVDQWRSFAGEDRTGPVVDEVTLTFILDVVDVDDSALLGDKFSAILAKANINLISSSSPPSPPRLSSPAGSIESVDTENDPLWLQAVALDNKHLANQVLGAWNDSKNDRRKAYEDYEDPTANKFADGVYETHVAVSFMSQWRERTREYASMQEQADQHRRKKDAATALKRWALAAREKKLARERDNRLASRTLEKWHHKTTEVANMEAVADDFRNHHAAKTVLGKMNTKAQQVKQAEKEAINIYDRRLARGVLAKWRAKVEEARYEERRADAAREFFLAMRVFNRLRDNVQFHLQERVAQEAREHVLAVKYIHKWRVATRENKAAKYNVAYKTIRRKVKINIGRAALTIWVRKTRVILAMKKQADEFRARKDEESARRVAHGAIVTMYNQTEQAREDDQRADRFYNNNLVKRLQIFGTGWLEPTRQILKNQEIADKYHQTREATYAVGVLRDWRNAAFRAKRLEEDAEALRQRREKQSALSILQKWRGAANRSRESGNVVENTLVPATPAARRSQLLASTTPAYTPAPGFYGSGGRVIEEETEDGEAEQEE